MPDAQISTQTTSMMVNPKVIFPISAQVTFPTPKREAGILSLLIYQYSTRFLLPQRVAQKLTALSLGGSLPSAITDDSRTLSTQ